MFSLTCLLSLSFGPQDLDSDRFWFSHCLILPPVLSYDANQDFSLTSWFAILCCSGHCLSSVSSVIAFLLLPDNLSNLQSCFVLSVDFSCRFFSSAPNLPSQHLFFLLLLSVNGVSDVLTSNYSWSPGLAQHFSACVPFPLYVRLLVGNLGIAQPFCRLLPSVWHQASLSSAPVMLCVFLGGWGGLAITLKISPALKKFLLEFQSFHWFLLECFFW